MVISIISIAVNYVVAVTMVRYAGLGHAGLALSTSAVALTGFVALFALLRARIGGIYGRELMEGISKVALASAVMGGGYPPFLLPPVDFVGLYQQKVAQTQQQPPTQA